MENVTDDKYISLICNGEFNAIPDFKIGELFESFFDNINYNVIKEENKIFVDFTGEATCDDEPCTIIIRFEVDDEIEEFEIVEVKVDDTILNEQEILDLLEDIAYTGGATLEEDYCDDCDNDGNCQNCNFSDDEEDFYENYDDDEENYDNEDEDNEDDDDN